MTTTISYNGSTIASIENQTKTLTTAGKYVPYSFVVTDITSSTGGDYSIDDIAMKNISGSISGSATYIGNYAFYSCSALTAVDFPNVTSIGSSAFGYCSSLSTASFPNVTSIGISAFGCCSSLTTVSFPSVTTISSYAFYNCDSLTAVDFPNATAIGNNAFYSCDSLSTASFPNVTSIGTSTFYACFNLISLYLNSISTVPTLSGVSTFFATPIGGRTSSTSGVYGSVYVPASLYSSFLTAENWSSIAERIVSISDSSSSSIPDTLAAKFVKRWYDTGSTASCDTTNHYTTLPNLPLVLGNPVTHLTYQIVTDSAFSVQLNGATSPMGEGPRIYLSSAVPTDIDYMGTCIYSHADDGMDWATVSEAFSVSAGNNGKYLTIHTWCDDWDNDICTEATVQVSLYSGEYYLLKK